MSNINSRNGIAKALLVLLLGVCLLGSTFMAYADADEVNVGVSENPAYLTESSGIGTYGTSKPGVSDLWDCDLDGKYSFSGQGAYNSLYTDYMFLGQKSYAISVYNNNGYNDELTCEVYKNRPLLTDTVIKEFVATGLVNTDVTVSGLTKSEKIYIKFIAPCNFSGWIN